MNEEKNVICIEDNKKNHDALVKVAGTIYRKRMSEFDLPLIMGSFFDKYISKSDTKTILNAVLNNDDSWFRDIVTYGIIYDLIGGLTDIPYYNSIKNTEEFWSVIYKHFNLNVEYDTFTENDIIKRYGDAVALNEELSKPCNKLIQDLIIAFGNGSDKNNTTIEEIDGVNYMVEDLGNYVCKVYDDKSYEVAEGTFETFNKAMEFGNRLKKKYGFTSFYIGREVLTPKYNGVEIAFYGSF